LIRYRNYFRVAIKESSSTRKRSRGDGLRDSAMTFASSPRAHGSTPSYWWRTAIHGRSFCQAGALRSHWPIIIIGAGVTGLAAALELASRGFATRTLVLERHFPGAGATGRSGGILVSDDDCFPDSEGDFAELERLFIDAGLGREIEIPSETSMTLKDEYANAIVNPLWIVAVLSILLGRTEVTIATQREVLSVRAHGEGLLLGCRGRSFTCDHCLLATGAYSWPRVRQLLSLDVYEESCMVVRCTGGRAPWSFYQPVSASDFVWGRQVSQSMFLFGGGKRWSSPSTASVTTAIATLRRGLETHLPSLQYSEVLASWSGRLSRFSNCDGWRVLPVPGLPKVLFVGGFDGYGLTAGIRAGRTAAAQLAELSC
jgi:glycine/D-amino acid oxidase-like deaminating enzyme